MFGRDLKQGNKYLAGGVPVPLLTAHKTENPDLVLLGHFWNRREKQKKQNQREEICDF